MVYGFLITVDVNYVPEEDPRGSPWAGESSRSSLWHDLLLLGSLFMFQKSDGPGFRV